MNTDIALAVRADALFVSDVQPSDPHTPATVEAAVQQCYSQYGPDECAARVAHEFGEHPDTAAGRMVWALCAVRA
jgi:hypothetical protein